MTALAAPSTVLTWLSKKEEDDVYYPVDAVGNTGSGIIYDGGMVGLNGALGTIRRWQSNDVFVGIALRSGKNDSAANPLDSVAGGAIGDGTVASAKGSNGLRMPIRQHGTILWRGAIGGVAAGLAAANTVVYCSDDGTLTNAAGGGNAKIGNILRYDPELGGFVILVAAAPWKNANS